jgi:hypothetical protein
MRDDSLVSTVAEIKEAIARLSPQEYCELMAELFPHAHDEWDKQMNADFASGKMDWLTKETEAAICEGKTIPLEKLSRKKNDQPDNGAFLALLSPTSAGNSSPRARELRSLAG